MMQKICNVSRHWLESGVTYLRGHFRAVTLIAGSVIISLWTLVRFWNTASVFDLVGQQLLTRQWLQGYVSFAYIGTTNYIWKMLMLYAPVELLPGSPRLKLVALTLAVNILTYVLLVLVLEKILREFAIKLSGLFYLGMVWLATIAGSVFWVQFTNSRNLEVVGGLWLLYFVLHALNHGSTWRYKLLAAAFGAVLFFSDPIQIYMTALPLLAFAAVLVLSRIVSWQRFLEAGCVVAAAYLGSKLVTALVVPALGLHIVSGPGLAPIRSYTAAIWAHDVLDTGRSFIQLYGGAIELGRVTQALNIAVLIGLIITALGNLWNGRRMLALVALVVGTDTGVYLLSGQAFSASTSRYLIMTMPMVMLLFGLAGVASRRRVLMGLAGVVIAANVVGLGVVSVKASAHRFAPDAHLGVVAAFVNISPYTYAYASMDTAIPASYYYRPRHPILPLSCGNDRLAKTYLFYERSVFRAAEQGYDGVVPVILNGSSMQNYPYVCDEAAIERQLGAPLAIQRTSAVDDVLLYRAATLRGL